MYGVCIVAGILCAWLWARWLAKQWIPRRDRQGAFAPNLAGQTLPHGRVPDFPSHIDLLIPLLVATGLLGAWLFGRWTDAATGEESHGAVLVGSLLIATAAGILYALAARIPLGVLGDICAAPLALGIAIGRLGCFFAGCCFGKECPTFLGVRFPEGSFAYSAQVAAGKLAPNAATSLPVYPTQLYESALCALLALFIWRFIRPRVPGEQFLAMGLGYAVVRFLVEFFRGDNPAVVGPLTFSQAAAIAIALAAGITWLARRKIFDIHEPATRQSTQFNH